jgi:hypothetical protein
MRWYLASFSEIEIEMHRIFSNLLSKDNKHAESYYQK